MDPRRLLPGLLVMAAVCAVTMLVVVVMRDEGDGRAPAHSTAVSAATSSAVSAAEILTEWDHRRSRAWASGDASALAELYLPESRAGAADVASLRRWAGRRLRVRGMRTQVLALTVAERSERRLVMHVTDRVFGGTAVGETATFALPADRASTRRIVMRKVGGQWLVADVRDQARAAASTSLTSSSSTS